MLLDNMRSRFRGKRNGTVLILSNGTLSLLPSNGQELFEDSGYRYNLGKACFARSTKELIGDTTVTVTVY